MKRKVFIIDDDKDYSIFIKSLLNKSGSYDVQLFDNEKDFLKNLSLQPEVIIVSHHLNGKNGLRLIERARTELPEVYSILLTYDSHVNLNLFTDERFINSIDRYIIKGMNEEYELIESLKLNLAN